MPYIYIYISVDDIIYMLSSWGLSTLVKELKATTCIMQTSFNELIIPVSIGVKCKQTKVDRKCVIFLS